MASIRATKKLLKKSKGFLTIKIKEENIEDGDTLFITPDDIMTFRMFGVIFNCAGFVYWYIPYCMFSSIQRTSK